MTHETYIFCSSNHDYCGDKNSDGLNEDYRRASICRETRSLARKEMERRDIQQYHAERSQQW